MGRSPMARRNGFILPNTGWNLWLVVWNIKFIFPYIGLLIIPIDFHIFQRGWNHQPDLVGIWNIFLDLETSTGTGMWNNCCKWYQMITEYKKCWFGECLDHDQSWSEGWILSFQLNHNRSTRGRDWNKCLVFPWDSNPGLEVETAGWALQWIIENVLPCKEEESKWLSEQFYVYNINSMVWVSNCMKK